MCSWCLTLRLLPGLSACVFILACLYCMYGLFNACLPLCLAACYKCLSLSLILCLLAGLCICLPLCKPTAFPGLCLWLPLCLPASIPVSLTGPTYLRFCTFSERLLGLWLGICKGWTLIQSFYNCQAYHTWWRWAFLWHTWSINSLPCFLTLIPDQL